MHKENKKYLQILVTTPEGTVTTGRIKRKWNIIFKKVLKSEQEGVN